MGGPAHAFNAPCQIVGDAETQYNRDAPGSQHSHKQVVFNLIDFVLDAFYRRTDCYEACEFIRSCIEQRKIDRQEALLFVQEATIPFSQRNPVAFR